MAILVIDIAIKNRIHHVQVEIYSQDILNHIAKRLYNLHQVFLIENIVNIVFEMTLHLLVSWTMLLLIL